MTDALRFFLQIILIQHFRFGKRLKDVPLEGTSIHRQEQKEWTAPAHIHVHSCQLLHTGQGHHRQQKRRPLYSLY